MSQNSDFGTFGRFIETPVDKMPAEMKEAYDFTKKLRGLVPGPHKIWLANPKLSKTVVPTGGILPDEVDIEKSGNRNRHERSPLSVGGCRPIPPVATRKSTTVLKLYF